jgi:flagellar motor switch protein FliG
MKFKIDVIPYLDDDAIIKILQVIDSSDLSLALSTCNERIRNKFYGVMSKHSVMMLVEDLTFTGYEIALKYSPEEQQKIIDVVSKLIDIGKIKFSEEQYKQYLDDTSQKAHSE